MVAGVGGIDGVIMVIAADEGIMPQTREHLDICRLLSVKHGIIALTKADMVDQEWIELVSEDLKKTVKDTFLENAAIIPVSSTTGAGVDTLLSAIENMIVDIPEKPSSGTSRLPIDRVFSMKGFGTVVTGTLFAGKLKVGDEVEIVPENIKTKIRGAQVHGQQVETVIAGQRTALNLQGIEKGLIKRGDLVSLPSTVVASQRIDVWFHHLSSAPRPLKNRAIVRFHSGTSEIFGRVTLLDRDELKPGESTFVQLFLEKRTALFPGDSYVIRS
jgi:selenocysteine-specific elongation factor